MKLPKYTHGFLKKRVTCKHEVEAYYSNYGGLPKLIFKPGMKAYVKSITPKVRISGQQPTNDTKEYFLVCDYFAPETNSFQRVGLNFCNVSKIKD